MPSSEIGFEVRRRIAAPAPVVWALAADTNRVDRMLGAGRAFYSYGQGRVGAGRVAGMDATWIERGEWVEGEFFVGERHYLTGVLLLVGLRVDVAPAAHGCDVAFRSYMRPRQPLPDGGAMLAARMRAGLEQYLDALDRIAATLDHAAAGAGDPPGDRSEPAVTRARRALFAAEPPEAVSGKVTIVAEAQWEYCTSRFVEAPVEPAVRERVLTFLRTRPDQDLLQIRPFELARTWQLAPRAVLAAFLHATRAGLTNLRWELACPVCRVGAGAADALAALGPRAHCSECALDFDLDFARNVEAVFQVNPSIRPVEPRLYCAGSPWFRPHVFARVEVPPNGRRELAVTPPQPDVLVRTLSPRPLAAEVLYARGLVIRVTPGGLETAPGDRPGLVVVDNQTADEVSLHLERMHVDVAAALGVDVVTLPGFLDLFATDAPATGVDLTVGQVTLLFSDLTGMTALNERLGDARAFALVEDHFRRMANVIAAHGGAMVKTMGDAVMATFAAPDHALEAAIDMAGETRAALAGHGLMLKVGLHSGPCLLVRANQRIDFFGTTVNVAARLQGQARGDQVAFLAELLAHPGVAQALDAHALAPTRTSTALKGLTGTHDIVVVSI